MEEKSSTTGGKRTTAPAGSADTTVPAAAPAAGDESASARAARELREAADRQPMSEGVRQDILQGGSAHDPLTGRTYGVEDLSPEDREVYRRSHAVRTDK